MKISPSKPNNTPARSAVELNSASPASPAQTGPAAQRPIQSSPPTDQAQLSSLSSYLAAALSGSPAHAAKVSALGTAVSNGQYHMDAYTVSGSLIQYSIEFGGSGYAALST